MPCVGELLITEDVKDTVPDEVEDMGKWCVSCMYG